MEVFGEVKIGEEVVWCNIDPNELVFTFGGFYVCANFGENLSRNLTVRVRTNGQTDAQTQTGFIISVTLYAIAMWQIIN